MISLRNLSLVLRHSQPSRVTWPFSFKTSYIAPRINISLPRTATRNVSNISRLRIPDESDLPSETQKLIAQHHSDNWVRAFSVNPDTARRFVTYYEDLFTNPNAKLPLWEREIIAVVTSATNRCGLCTANHTIGLSAAIGGDRIRAKRIAADHHLVELTEREHALADLSERLTLAPRTISAQDLDQLRQVGFEDEEILEAVETISWFNHSNRITIALGIVPDQRYFE
ncbi:hypothetical protein Plec18170_008968 [Paecilomyces lecythidis]